MNRDKEMYARETDPSGEEIYCPIDPVSGRLRLTQEDLDECVEASTVGRYSGNISVVNRFGS